MKINKNLKEPSIKKILLIISGLFFGSCLLGISFGSLFIFLIGITMTSAYIIKTIKKTMQYYKLLEDGKIEEEIEEKESIFSKVKNKVKTLGKRNRKNKKNNEKKNSVVKIVNSKKTKQIQKSNTQPKISKQIEDLKKIKSDIIDGQYGLKKNQIIQDRVNIREINKYYEKYTNNNSESKANQKVYKKTA